MDFALNLEESKDTPLYRQIADQIRERIESGYLHPGVPVPSSRRLAEILGVSRITVVKSYVELLSQGYLETYKGSGTYVRSRATLGQGDSEKSADDRSGSAESRQHFLSSYGRRMQSNESTVLGAADLPALSFGAPPPELLPLKQWRQAVLKHCSARSGADLTYGVDALGYQPLRQAIASFLNRSRGLRCAADNVAVFSNSQQALELVATLFVDGGDNVVVEDPGFVQARLTFLLRGAHILPVPVDEAGLVVPLLENLPKAKLAYVTPSHQDPTGVTMSVRRRNTLLRWAVETGTLIVEDDYDCEYRFGTAPLPALQGLDTSEIVIYISNFWKILYPLSSVGFLVFPSWLTKTVSEAKCFSERHFSILEQRALTEFIEGGHLERHLYKSKVALSFRRAALILALTRQFGAAVQIGKETGGLHLVAKFQLGVPNRELIILAQRAGLPLASTEHYYVEAVYPDEFLISFASLTESEIEARVSDFAGLVRTYLDADPS